MQEINIQLAKSLTGGAFNPSAAVLTILKSAIEPLFLLGQQLGSALRRIDNNNLCKFQN